MILIRSGVRLAFFAFAAAALAFAPAVFADDADGPHWTPAGWGGGGFFYAAAYHPTKDGTIYVAGDVNGIYKTIDHGQHWRIINDGIPAYGVFSLAADPSTPDTVYAATEGGLCKSTDAGEHWTVLPDTGTKALHITGEKGHSIRSIAVDPTDSNVIYAGTPGGKIFKSQDGGQTWAIAYQKTFAADAPDSVRVQFGKATGAPFGGIWMPLALPATVEPADAVGIGFSFTPEGVAPRDSFLLLKTSDDVTYRSKNLSDIFKGDQLIDVILAATDFIVDPDFKTANVALAATAAATPDLSKVVRVDLACIGGLENTATVGHFTQFFFAATKTTDGKTGTAEKPLLVAAREFSKDKVMQSYGNIRFGAPEAGSVLTVAVSPKDHALVAAATKDSGLLVSNDAGQTWRAVDGPKNATSVAFSGSDANVVYAAFGLDGVFKSQDRGQTWAATTNDSGKGYSVHDIAINPMDPQDVYAIATHDFWVGRFIHSSDGGQTWTKLDTLKPDTINDPTLPAETANGKPALLSSPTNIVINPTNPKELFCSANWRTAISEDGGKTWAERAAGMDISCVTDIRFHGGKTYVSVMDEGVLTSANDGATWQQLWPLHTDPKMSGHIWRLAIDDINGAERIISTSSPWNEACNNQIVLSNDGGKTFATKKQGLPDYLPRPNTMWGRGYPRALAVDPNNPMTVYMGIDGEPSNGKSGGGVFKSDDGGNTWRQLAGQPASRRMYYGLAVDPTDSKRLFFATCGTKGGLYRSEDGGESWKLVFSKESWQFNVFVASDGTVYSPGTNLWRSTDHGQTWKQISNFNNQGAIIGLEIHPKNAKTIWVSLTTWGGAAKGGVFKTTDGGDHWQEITGDLPNRQPLVIRFNPGTNELWAGNVGLYKLKQQ